jgi:hypothetical protein
MSEREIVFWGAEDDGNLSHEDIDEAIEEVLDGAPCGIADRLPIITMCGFARMPVSMSTLSPLEHCLEHLDEEYGDPDGDSDKPTPAMLEAEKVFLAVIQTEYKSWTCEVVERRKINVADWIKEHRPDWLEEVAR